MVEPPVIPETDRSKVSIKGNDENDCADFSAGAQPPVFNSRTSGRR
jgi:hypothetical protein